MSESWLFSALIYLTAALIMVPIAKKSGLGSVLGYLLAGILIGPYLLGFIGEEGEDIMHAAEFGVVLMLFLIGLELDPKLLWSLRIPILGMGGIQVLATSAVIAGLTYVLSDLGTRQSIALGLTMAMSSTAIVLQSLKEKGLMKTDAGQRSFAVLLFQDIAVIPILSILPLLNPEAESINTGHESSAFDIKSHLSPGLQTLFVLGSVALVVVIGRYVVAPLMKVIAKTHQRELFPAFALLLVFTITFLMGLAGLSPALGAFLAGVVLANSPYRHQLEVDLEPVKGLLLGLFFMAVGASIDFQIIAHNPLNVFGLVLGLMAIKGLILFALGKYFKMGTDQNILYSVGLAQTGEFAFVLLSFIGQLSLLETEVIDLVMVVVAISMAMTPLLMLIVERVILPVVGTKRVEAHSRPEDKIEGKSGKVIIAGFGRFGAIAGRFLRANGVSAIILDNDSDRVDLLREIGFEVYYGDATQPHLLEAAGAEEAEAILIGLPTPEQNVNLVKTVKKHFPDLHIIVRSFDYTDTYELMDEGVLHIFRDVIQNGVSAASEILRLLGHRAYSINRNAKKFLLHDQETLKSLASVRTNKKQYISTVRDIIADLEQQIRNDTLTEDPIRDIGWDTESLRKSRKPEVDS